MSESQFQSKPSSRTVLIGPTAQRYKGGIAQFSSRLAEELSRRGPLMFITWYQIYPYFLSRRDFIDRVSLDRISGVESEPILGYMNPLSWFKAARAIRKFDPATIVFTWTHPVHAPVYLLLLYLLRRSTSAKIVVLCHNVMPHENAPGGRWLSRRIFNGADRLVVHGSSERELAAKIVGDTKVTSLYLPLFDRLKATEIGSCETSKFTLLFFGIIRYYKGLDILLRAMPSIRESFPDVRLKIAGEHFSPGEGDSSPLALIEELGLSEVVETDIRYIPNEEVGEIFNSAALAVFPYRSATQSGVVATAYANSVPVVATRVGSIPDMVADGVSGYLAEPESPESLASAVKLFFRNPISREQVAEFAQRFSWNKYVDELLNERTER